MNKLYFKSTLIQAGNFSHAFFGSYGGVSSGIYSSLNCNPRSADDKNNIKQNIEIICKVFNSAPHQLKTLNQIHSNTVVEVTDINDDISKINADAIITKVPGLLVGVQTADCTPILIADMKNNIVAAVHAGWRGAYNGVIENTIQKMQNIGADMNNAIAIIGPTIAQQSYEVDENFYQQFINKSIDNKNYFSNSKQPKHYMFNLPGYCSAILKRAKVGNVEDLLLDTYSQESQFFSFRRNTHEGKNITGGQLSVIGINK